MLISSLMSRRFGTKRPLRAPRKGFTLIELLVVSAIVLIITGLVLVRQSRFDSASLLRSLTYSVALSVRQAQAYGISAREATLGAGDFSKSYGVNFVDGTTDNYALFADVNLDGQFGASPDVLAQRFKFAQGYRINRFCAKQSSGGAVVCSPTITYLNIYFKRPNPDSLFRTNAGTAYTDGYIELTSGGGETRAVRVTTAGQITVCPVNQDATFSSC